MSANDATLRITSCMAPNMDGLCRDVCEHLSRVMGTTVEYVGNLPWQERERMFEAGDIDICWICGQPYIDKYSVFPDRYQIIAAPVMKGARYEGRAVYFSDVVVRDESHYVRFEDLRGCNWAYNEPQSHSGFGIVRYQLALRGETADFFGRVVESGSHQASLKLILNGRVDASAIDSTVLEQEIRRSPRLLDRIRVIGTLGPSPMPPWVIRKSVPEATRALFRVALLDMHRNHDGRALLDAWSVKRFSAVSDHNYDPIRAMMKASAHIRMAAVTT